MRHDEFLIDARRRLRALPPSEDVASVLHMVETNIAVTFSKRVIKSFDGAFVAREVARVIGSGTVSQQEHADPTRRSEAL